MNPLRSLLVLDAAPVRRAAVLSSLATLAATIPLAVIAFVLVRAVRGTIPRSAFEVAADAVVASLVVQIPLARAAARCLRDALEGRAEALRAAVVAHLRAVPARSLSALDPGQTLAVITLGLDDAIALTGNAFDALFGGLLRALCAVAVVAAIDWRIALVSLLFVPVAAGYLRQSRSVSSRATPRLVRARSEGASRFWEYVESIALLRSFGCTAERLRRLSLAIAELNVKAFENAVAPLTFGVIALFFVEFGFAIAMMIGVQIGGGTAGIAYILALTIALAYFQTLFGALDGYLRLRDAPANLHAIEWLLALPRTPAQTAALPRDAELVLEGVSFAYDREPVLRDVSLRFPQRAVTAIVGRSGAGKSALANVIAGLWDPACGSATIGGADVRTLDPALRAQTIAMVFQDAYVVEDTIANNIAAGNPAASAERVRWAARTAHCDAFVARFPQGYETIVRADGADLSPGERQRIAIARMLLSDAPVVVLDECTASLDAAAERAVHDAIDALAARKTVVLITHRLGTVRHAGLIVVLTAGRIAETGTHERLLQNGGEYARLWSAHERVHHWKAAS
jgi:ATP-binding cassette subfamily B protein